MGEAKKRGTKEERIKQAQLKKFGRDENTCIICRKNNLDAIPSLEHVIPESLGGNYCITSVCEKCNNDLGKSADSVLVNHKFSDFFRLENKIKGKGKALPNPFEGIFTTPSNPDLKYQTILLDEGKNLEMKLLPSPKIFKNENDEISTIEITVDAKDEKEIDKILEKIIKRNNLENMTVNKEISTVIQERNLPFQGKFSIDTFNFRMGLLKIAYEFMVDTYPEYFPNEDAKLISEILLNNDYEKLKAIKMTDGFDKTLTSKFGQIIDFNKNQHIIFSCSYDKVLMCLVKIKDVFETLIVMSHNFKLNLNEYVIGVNDIEKNEFKKTNFLNYINARGDFNQL
ncbi:HNH endonuclease [bacterium M00.F.Ca.ET.230.01.1.1]|jgi:hypothetical protein|nr:HNH endonuclease [bacterium M00.F.Ca.ET.230.01.1.1]